LIDLLKELDENDIQQIVDSVAEFRTSTIAAILAAEKIEEHSTVTVPKITVEIQTVPVVQQSKIVAIKKIHLISVSGAFFKYFPADEVTTFENFRADMKEYVEITNKG